MSVFREKLLEAQSVLREHMQDFAQMQFSIELNMSVLHEQTAGPIFAWEPSVDLILQTQDTVITGVEHLNEQAKMFLVGFFSSISNSIMASGMINNEDVSPWKGMEIEGTIFNGQYGWEGSEFIDYQITKRPGNRIIIGMLTVRDHDITIKHCIDKACELCDHIIVFVHKPTDEVSKLVVESKKQWGEKVIIRGILSKSSTETYLYPLCRTDTLVVPLNTDSFWSDACISETGKLMRQMDVSGYRGIDIQDCILDVAEIKSHPPDALGVTSHHKVTYMGNILKWGNQSSIGESVKNTSVYRDGVEKFARINVSYPGIMRMSYIGLSSEGRKALKKPDTQMLEDLKEAEVKQIDASQYLPRKVIARLMRGSARWSIFNT